MKFEKFTAVGVAIFEVQGDGWSAGFYLKPDAAVKVTGNKPDLTAFRDACVSVACNRCTVCLCMRCFRTALRSHKGSAFLRSN